VETSASLKEQEARVLERIRKYEREKAGYIARGEPVPGLINAILKEAPIQLEELRLWGHRAMMREAEEAQWAAGQRDIRDRVEAELERIRHAPTIDPADIRKTRGELGVTQYQLAAASGVDVDTISKIENGFDRYKPETLRFIAAGLDFIRAGQRESTRA